MAEILGMASMISYILAAAFFVLSVFLWFRFKIFGVIGDLSGRTARKSITRMREANEKNGARYYKAKSNFDREPVYRIKEEKDRKESSVETGLLSENKAGSVSAQTGLLVGETMEIAGSNETMELEKAHKDIDGGRSSVIEEIGFELIEELILIHTDEAAV